MIIGQSYVANNDMHELHQPSTSQGFQSTFEISHQAKYSLANEPIADDNMALRSLYEAYKESTKYPLDWLRSQIRLKSSQPCPRFQSTSEILNAAYAVQQQGIPVPSSVVAKLSDAIKKRREVLALFQSATDCPNEGNASHEAFIDRYLQEFSKPYMELILQTGAGAEHPLSTQSSSGARSVHWRSGTL